MSIYCQDDDTPQTKTNFLGLNYEWIFVHMLFLGGGEEDSDRDTE